MPGPSNISMLFRIIHKLHSSHFHLLHSRLSPQFINFAGFSSGRIHHLFGQSQEHSSQFFSCCLNPFCYIHSSGRITSVNTHIFQYIINTQIWQFRYLPLTCKPKNDASALHFHCLRGTYKLLLIKILKGVSYKAVSPTYSFCFLQDSDMSPIASSPAFHHRVNSGLFSNSAEGYARSLHQSSRCEELGVILITTRPKDQQC